MVKGIIFREYIFFWNGKWNGERWSVVISNGERERDIYIYVAVLANNRPRISSRFISAIRVESLWPNFWLKLSTAFEAGCRFYENQLLWSKSLPPPFSLPLLSLSISLSSRASASITRTLSVRVPPPKYQASYGVTLQGLRAAIPNIPNTLPIILPSFLRFNLFRASSPVIVYTLLHIYIKIPRTSKDSHRKGGGKKYCIVIYGAVEGGRDKERDERTRRCCEAGRKSRGRKHSARLSTDISPACSSLMAVTYSHGRKSQLLSRDDK